MVNTFFTSDHHFKHNNVIKLCNRPFESIEEMNEICVERWNNMVSPGDLVYYLGDFSLDPKAVKEFLPQLNGDKVLIQGNHDKCFKGKEKWIDLYKKWGFFEVLHRKTIKIWKYQVLLCHFPYKNDPGARYYDYRPEDRGNFLLHGHTHNKERIYRKMIHVGVDAWDFTPVPIEEVERLMGRE